MNTTKIVFKIFPSEISNDHETRIYSDKIDILGKEFLGIDPPLFFAQAPLFEGGQALIGRCDRGHLGCDDLFAEISVSEQTVCWQLENGVEFNFDKFEYFEELENQKNNFSWEDTNRTVERLLTPIFRDLIINQNFTFDWVSARYRKNQITLSYSYNGQQFGLCFDWDGINIEDAIEKSEQFIKKTKCFEK